MTNQEVFQRNKAHNIAIITETQRRWYRRVPDQKPGEAEANLQNVGLINHAEINADSELLKNLGDTIDQAVNKAEMVQDAENCHSYDPMAAGDTTRNGTESVTPGIGFVTGWTDRIKAWINFNNGIFDTGMTTENVLMLCLGIANADKATQMKISEIMRGLGYVKTRCSVNGVRDYFWKPA